MHYTVLVYTGKYPEGCHAFERISHNVGRDESNIKEDQETLDEQTYTEVGVVWVWPHQSVGLVETN